jgi:glycosyltransferase involved in cell wall biosynthesis
MDTLPNHISRSPAPRVAVVIPGYGCARTIGRVLDALLDQTIPPQEIIVVNDHSPDNLDEAVRPYLDRILHIKNPRNMGLAKSYNVGLERATADYVMTLHSDCVLDPDYIETLLGHFKANADVGAATGQYLFDDPRTLALSDRMFIILNRIPLETDRHDQSVQSISFIEGKADLFRRAVISRYGYFNPSLVLTAEDQELSARMRADGVQLIQDARCRFRVLFNETSSSLWKILNKQRTYARGQAYVMLKFGRRAFSRTTSNRRSRAFHRMTQLGFAAAMWALLIAAFWDARFLAVLLGVILARAAYYYAIGAPFRTRDRCLAALLGPLADHYYLAGAMEGAVRTLLFRRT